MSTEGSTGGGDQRVGSTGMAAGGGGSSAAGSTGAASFGGWGEGWRTQLAGANPDELKRLERFQGPENIYESYRALEKRLSAGELRPVLHKDARPEEVTRWRQEMGIPAKAEEYKINMPAGKQPPKEDDAFLKAFLASAHEANYTQAQVDKAVTAFYAEVERNDRAVTEAEAEATRKMEDQLRSEWGGDYRLNMTMADALLDRAPAGFRDRFMNGTLADGTPIKASPEARKWLVQLEREVNPAATVVPGAGGDVGKTLAAEIADLKACMSAPKGTPEYKKYWEQGGEARYRQLLDAQSKIQARAA